MWVVVFICSCFLHQSWAYKAAVVGHYPVSSTGSSPKDYIKSNLQEYRVQVELAIKQNVDIIVFPEYGLTGIVDDPEGFAIDMSQNDDDILTELRDMAKEHHLYIVVNLLEKNNDGNKIYYYNTNLVFNRDGEIIAKYRKINLYQEPNLTAGNETVTFRTDFDVTFGLFTCFDIVHANPAKYILDDNPQVTDIIFPTAWISTMPIFTALTVQQGYAMASGVNLLAANYVNPKQSYGGSGIYSADGQISDIYLDVTPSTKMIVKTVKEIATRVDNSDCGKITRLPRGLPPPDGGSYNDINQFVTKKVFEAEKYTFKKIDTSAKNETTTEVCDGSFCCTFRILVDGNNVNTKEIYKIMAFDGTASMDQEEAHLRICSLLVCENESNDSCGARINTTTRFIRIGLGANVPSDDDTFYRPATLNYLLRPIGAPDVSYCNSMNKTNQSSYIQLATHQSQSQILVFGFFGRVNSGSTFSMANVVLLLVAAIFTKIFTL